MAPKNIGAEMSDGRSGREEVKTVKFTELDRMKSMKRWFLWKYSTRKGKKTKVPFSAYGGETGVDKAHSSTWATYEECMAAKDRMNADGAGFVLPDDYFFLDIDHMALTDAPAKDLLDRIKSYAELSPSGNGCHILGKINKSRLPLIYDAKKGRYVLNSRVYYQKNPKLSIELYFGAATNRYATFTGNAVNDLDITDCTDAVLATLDKEMRKQPGKNAPAEYECGQDYSSEELFDVIASLRKQKNGEKFSRLYDKGDTSGYGSPSEADASLAGMLAFRLGDNPDAIWECIRSSALYRDKWERDDYRDSTIRFAIDSLNGQFHISKRNRPEYIVFNADTCKEYVIAPLLAKFIRTHLPYILVRDTGRQALMKYVYEEGCYRYYSDDMFKGKIKQYIADYDETLVKMRDVNEVLQHINTDLNYVPIEELNADENIINFRNGLLKIDGNNLELLPHSPKIFSTIQLPCDWSGQGTDTPVFDSYMDTLTDGDAEVRRLLYEFIGVCLSNLMGWRMKKSLFLVGKGDTGKSQLKSLVEKLLGKGNFVGIDLKDIEARFGTGSIYGKRLAGSSDMSFLSVTELKTFKELTGGDSVFAEFKGLPSFEYTYSGLLWFCMNKLPKFGGDDGKWVYDRILVVECRNVIPQEKQDRHLLDKMYAERDGIIFKAVKALQNVIRNSCRFTEPKSVADAMDRYHTENNTVVSFFLECMCERPDGKISDGCTTGKVYKVYQAWCRDNNNGYAKTYKEFREKLAEHLDTSFEDMVIKRKNGTFYRNYTLTLECKQEYSAAYGYEEVDFLA